MGEFGVNQYDIVVNVFSLAIAAMGAATLFFFTQRNEVLPRYRMTVTLLGLITAISTYSYIRLYENWTHAYSVVNGTLRSSGIAFNDGFRYADWLLTVPLLLVALVLVLDIPATQAKLRSTVLSVLAIEMVIMGYPGQLATTAEARWLWWGVAMVPAVVIVYQLYIGLGTAVAAEPEASRRLVRRARLLLVTSWSAYPVFYLFPLLGVTGGTAFTVMEVGYVVADILAKVVFGWLLFRMAAVKSRLAEEPVMLPSALRAVRG